MDAKREKRPAPHLLGPVEPVLELDDIQGIAVPGFLKPHQALVYLRFPGGRQGLLATRAAIAELVAQGAISSGATTLKDRRDHRRFEMDKLPAADRLPLVAVGFTAQGLRKFTPAVRQIPSPAFLGGLAQRAALLGDPTDPNDQGSPQNWVVGKPGEELDAMLVVAGDHSASVRKRAAFFASTFANLGGQVSIQHGDVRSDARGHEHFGFDDGISQPGIRGRASNAADDYVTDRRVDPSDLPDAWLYGYPGQMLIWPGELIFGYPKSSPDPLIPGPVEQHPPWMRNGSFLVYRRLRQDVAAFWQTMRAEADRLRQQRGFENLDDVRLATQLVGRWPSGAPLSRTPNADDPALGDDSLANNDFQFDNDTPKRTWLGKKQEKFPIAKADPVGLVCPAGAHIRKVNVRDAASDVGGASATQMRRVLRVGVPFGDSLADKYGEQGPDPLNGDRGLLFLSIQASIEEQFEFLQARWINNRARPRGPGGHDMIVGQNAATKDGVRRCHLFGTELQTAEVRANRQFVVPTGGGYFVIPSLSAIRTVIAPTQRL
jgi:Dyp-type peroxidase family